MVAIWPRFTKDIDKRGVEDITYFLTIDGEYLFDQDWVYIICPSRNCNGFCSCFTRCLNHQIQCFLAFYYFIVVFNSLLFALIIVQIAISINAHDAQSSFSSSLLSGIILLHILDIQIGFSIVLVAYSNEKWDYTSFFVHTLLNFLTP